MAGETTYATSYNGVPFQGMGNNVSVLDVTHEIATTELQTADKVVFGKVPKGAIYLSGFIATDDLDSNGTPTCVLDVGDDDDADGLMDGTTTGQAAAITTFNGAYITNRTAITAEKSITLTVQTAAATAVTGTVRIVLYYYTP